MIDQGNSGVKHFPFQDVEVEFALGFELEPRDFEPADDAEVLAVAEHILVPRVHAPEPAHREEERVGEGVEAGPEPQVRKGLVVDVVTRGGVETELLGGIETDIVEDIGVAGDLPLPFVDAQGTVLGRKIIGLAYPPGEYLPGHVLLHQDPVRQAVAQLVIAEEAVGGDDPVGLADRTVIAIFDERLDEVLDLRRPAGALEDPIEDRAGPFDGGNIVEAQEGVSDDLLGVGREGLGVIDEVGGQGGVECQPGDLGERQAELGAEAHAVIVFFIAGIEFFPPAVLPARQGGAKREIEEWKQLDFEGIKGDLGEVVGHDGIADVLEIGLEAGSPQAEIVVGPGPGNVHLRAVVGDRGPLEVVVELPEEVKGGLVVDVGHQAEARRQRLVVLEPEDVGVRGVRAAGIGLEEKIVKLGLSARPAAEQIAIFQSASDTLLGIVIDIEGGVHIPGHRPVKALAEGISFDPGIADLRHQEPGRALPVQRVAQVGPVKHRDLLDPENRVPHLHIIVSFEVGPGAGKIPARRRLGAGRQPGFGQAEKVAALPLDRLRPVKNIRLDHSIGLLEGVLTAVQVVKDLFRADHLVGRLDDDVSAGDDILAFGVDIDLVGEELEILVVDFDIALSEDPVFGLFPGLGQHGDRRRRPFGFCPSARGLTLGRAFLRRRLGLRSLFVQAGSP